MNASEDGHAHREHLKGFVHSWGFVAAVLCDAKFEVLESNAVAELLSPAFGRGMNLVRFAFLSPDRNPDQDSWQRMSRAAAVLLRKSIDEHDSDRAFDRIVGELSAKSHDFAEAWASRDLAPQTSGPITFPTSEGVLELTYNLLKAPGDEGDVLLLLTPSDDVARGRLNGLASSVSA